VHLPFVVVVGSAGLLVPRGAEDGVATEVLPERRREVEASSSESLTSSLRVHMISLRSSRNSVDAPRASTHHLNETTNENIPYGPPTLSFPQSQDLSVFGSCLDSSPPRPSGWRETHQSFRLWRNSSKLMMSGAMAGGCFIATCQQENSVGQVCTSIHSPP
jgi:hypothetical protein